MTARTRTQKPVWPYRREVVLTAYGNGQWGKRISGKVRYFGSWDDPKAALDRFFKEHGDLRRGVEPARAIGVGNLVNAYLTHRLPDVRHRDERFDGKTQHPIGPVQWRRYEKVGGFAIEVFGRHTPAEDLGPADFQRLLTHLRGRYGAVTLGAMFRSLRTIFQWGFDNSLLPVPMRFGPGLFGGGSKRVRRQARREGRRKMFDADTIHALLAHARPQVRAMILLGINGGYYSIDCCDLTHDMIDRERAVIDTLRMKTGVPRLVPLWPETVAALDSFERPKPMDPAHENRVFITQRGRLWATIERQSICDKTGRILGVSHNDYLGQELRRLFVKACIPRPEGCGFSWFRHTFYTIARRSRDIDSVNAIMGHAGDGMTDHYLEEVDIEGVRAVGEHVHRWLFTQTAGSPKARSGAGGARSRGSRRATASAAR